MKTFPFLLLCLGITLTAKMQAVSLGFENLIESEFTNTEIEAPNPLNLKPQWWKYFEVNGDELIKRIQIANQNLQATFANIPYDKKENVETLLNNIRNNLHAFATAKMPHNTESLPDRIPLNSYSLDQRLDIHHKIRKLALEIKNEEEESEQNTIKIKKAEKFIDNLMVSYLANSKSVPEKFILGLHIIQRRIAMAITEQNNTLLKNRMEHHHTQIKQLQNELDTSLEFLDLQVFDENQMNAEIKKAQHNYEIAQTHLADAEVNVLDIFNETPEDNSMRHLLEDKVIDATLKKALSWVDLSFLILKFNLFMQTNNRFQDDKQILREQQEEWKNKIKHIQSQIKEWRVSVTKEQDQIHQENGLLIAQHDSSQAKLLRINQNRRQESANILIIMQLLEEKLLELQWLLDLLDHDIKNKSSFLERVWVYVEQSFVNIWKQINFLGNFSLFKLIGIPITFFIIIKVIAILISTIFASMIIRTAFIPLMMRQGKFSDSCGKLIHYCVLLLGVVTALISIGIDSGNLFLLAGALVFGIGFGFQSVVNNIFCGFRILFSRKIKIGDYVELESGSYGKVTEIQLQYTIVTTSDGIDIIVPNSELIDKILINWTMNNDYRRIRIPFVTGTECDKELIRSVVCEASLSVPCTMYNNAQFSNPQVWLVGFGENGLNFELVVWVNLRIKTHSDSREADYLWEIESALRTNHISMPMSEQRLYIERFKSGSKNLVKRIPESEIKMIG